MAKNGHADGAVNFSEEMVESINSGPERPLVLTKWHVERPTPLGGMVRNGMALSLWPWPTPTTPATPASATFELAARPFPDTETPLGQLGAQGSPERKHPLLKWMRVLFQEGNRVQPGGGYVTGGRTRRS